MLSRKYSLQKPSDVRELALMGDDVKLMLALMYAVNDLQAKAGYLLKQSQTSRNDETKIRLYGEYSRHRIKRMQLSAKLKQYLKIKGYSLDRQMGGRVRGIYARLPHRGAARPPGGLKEISQKGLFIFSDMYSEDTLLSIIVNETMFQE